MSYSESAALEALASVQDPISGRDIVSAGRLSDLSFEDGTLRAVLQIDPDRSAKYVSVRKAVQDTLQNMDGVETVSVVLTAHSPAPKIKQRQKQSPNPHKARRPEGYQGDAFVDHVIAVSSAKGGVGKSTIAVNLAVALAKQGKNIGLLDADIHGPSIPILLGVKGERAMTREVEGRRLIAPIEAFGIKTMSIGFMVENDGPIVWRGPMVQGAISRMLWDVDWGDLDILIIDMPPGTGDPQLGLAQDIKPRGAVIVSTPQDLALADARKGVAMFAKVDIPVMGLVENMSVFVCPDCGSEHNIFGTDGAKREAEKIGVPLLGHAPLHLSIRESGDQGVPIASRDNSQSEIFAGIATELWKTLE